MMTCKFSVYVRYLKIYDFFLNLCGANIFEIQDFVLGMSWKICLQNEYEPCIR